MHAGLLDRHLIAELPDRQLALAVESVSDEDLEVALADATPVAERVRERRGFDRATVRRRARERATELADGGDADGHALGLPGRRLPNPRRSGSRPVLGSTDCGIGQRQ